MPMHTTEDMLKAEDRTHTFAVLLTEYLKEAFSYKRPAVTLGISPCTVCAKTAKYDLYFRVTPPSALDWESNTLVVSRIGFTQKRRGYGKDLMQFLTGVAPSLPYTHICIEQANLDAKAFGTKLGFTRLGESNNMLASVEEVLKHLR
ncbi:hypothetical protein DCO48_10610 [Pseudomonas sp. SDI]|uniref:hypothetical protein n=1 Tax=Pseudomonas sp. SDI TaxID=2170734 RepID=UPI000DE5F60C|nr:hypothetical protein [Pseudomonas sp. SDI]PWB33108.1 hypothetical protein DCO48_10610 [Pseudomonas sp. SDI]